MRSINNLLAAALLPATLVAQKVCSDDADFDGTASFQTPWGTNGTCQEWMDQYFSVALNTTAECEAPMTFSLHQFGSVQMAAFAVQKMVAFDAGCCTGANRNFACSDDTLTYPSCTTAGVSYVRAVGGHCEPCYGQVINGQCGQCWQLDTKACTQSACSGLGIWANGVCTACNSAIVESCPYEIACTSAGGVWMSEDSECLPACSENNVRACSENECAGLTNTNWHCTQGSDCACRKCCRGEADCFNGHYSFCSQDQCMEASMPDLTYTSYTEWVYDNVNGTYGETQATRCSRCFHDAETEEGDSFGCITRQTCEAYTASGFLWTCTESEGVHCCAICSQGDVSGCQSQGSCEQNGGAWNTDAVSGQGHCSQEQTPTVNTPAAASTPACAKVSTEHAQWLTAIGFSPRKCTDC